MIKTQNCSTYRAKIQFPGPKALILSPTRELAIQIHQEVQKYSYRGIRRYVYCFDSIVRQTSAIWWSIFSAVIYGGSSRKNQVLQCEAGTFILFQRYSLRISFCPGVEIIIATPGRLNDLIMSNVLDVRSVTFLVEISSHRFPFRINNIRFY